MGEKLLTYYSQLEFKAWAKKHGLAKNGADFYFDNIYAVDATNGRQPTIRGVVADGTMTWNDALTALKKHFKIA